MNNKHLNPKPGMVLMWDGKERIWKSVLSLNDIEYKKYQRKQKLEKLNAL